MKLECSGEEIDFVLSVSDVTEIGLRISHTGLVEFAEASGLQLDEIDIHPFRNIIHRRTQ